MQNGDSFFISFFHFIFSFHFHSKKFIHGSLVSQYDLFLGGCATKFISQKPTNTNAKEERKLITIIYYNVLQSILFLKEDKEGA